MIALLLALPLLLGVSIGWLLIRVAWGTGGRLCIHDLWRASLGAGIGCGVAATIQFLALALGFSSVWPVIGIEIGIALLLLALAARQKKRCPFCEASGDPQKPIPVLLYTCGAVILASFCCFVLLSILSPHGEWDAYSIWNLRARFLFAGGDFWTDALSRDLLWSHPDYPLMIPALVASLWKVAGVDDTLGPMMVAFVFTFASAGLLGVTVGVLRGGSQGLLAAMLVMGAPAFVRDGASQYADIPVGFFMLAAVCLLALQAKFAADGRYTLLAGLSAGFAAWTKNEGVLFLGVIFIAIIYAAWMSGTANKLPKTMLLLISGALPVLCVVIFFKWRYAPPNDLLANHGQALFDGTRIGTVVKEFAKNLWDFGGFVVSPLIALAIYIYCMGIDKDSRRSAGGQVSISSVILMLLGYACVYLTLSNDIAWQLTTSLMRLLIQIWPLAVLTTMLWVVPPERHFIIRAPTGGR